MRRFRTLRTRFALWVAGLLLMALAAGGAFVYGRMAQGLTAGVDDSLQLSAAQASAAANIEDDELSISDSVPEPAAFTSLRERGLTIRLLTTDGRVLQAVGAFRSMPIRAEAIAAARRGAATFSTFDDQGQAVRLYTAPIGENGRPIGVVQIAQTLVGVQQTLDQLRTTLLIAVPLLVILAGSGGYVLAARALAPIDAITRAAQHISAEDLHARLHLPATDDEVGRLAGTFDGMIARLEGAFQRERQFTSDASHELRTPLAAMQVILSVTRTAPRTTAVYEQALDDLAEEANRLRNMIEDLLRLARGEARQLAARDVVDLAVLLHDVCDTLCPLAAAKGLTLTCAAVPPLPLTSDSDALIRLFSNLVGNAVKYTDHGRVAVRAQRVAGALQTTITDTGIGIAAHHLPRLFDRFYRVDASRSSGGAGLGLAIAHEIVTAHGGTITVESTVGQGTTVTVRLPADPPRTPR